MACYDGSGDISFSKEEFQQIGAAITKAAQQMSGYEYLTICKSTLDPLGGKPEVKVEIRAPRFRGPVEELGFNLIPFSKR